MSPLATARALDTSEPHEFERSPASLSKSFSKEEDLSECSEGCTEEEPEAPPHLKDAGHSGQCVGAVRCPTVKYCTSHKGKVQCRWVQGLTCDVRRRRCGPPPHRHRRAITRTTLLLHSTRVRDCSLGAPSPPLSFPFTDPLPPLAPAPLVPPRSFSTYVCCHPLPCAGSGGRSLGLCWGVPAGWRRKAEAQKSMPPGLRTTLKARSSVVE